MTTLHSYCYTARNNPYGQDYYSWNLAW